MARETTKISKAVEDLTQGTDTTTSTDDLQAQIAQLKEDIAGIAETLANLGAQSVRDAKQSAGETYKSAVQQGEDALGDLKNCAQNMEQQLTDTIRERPIASLATAVGIGYLFALLSRR